MNDNESYLRSVLARVASGAPLEESLGAVAEAASRRVGADAAKVWLVKQGDRCATCQLAQTCRNREMCLHLKVATGETARDYARVPLVVFTDRVASRGGVGRFSDGGTAASLLFGPDRAEKLEGDTYAAVQIKGPAGVLGLLAVAGRDAITPDDLAALQGYADAAVMVVRVADLTSRWQRTSMRLEEGLDESSEVKSLLHCLLYGSTEYNVIAEDLSGNITVFSDGARHTYGYAPEDVIGRAKADILYAPEEVETGKVVEILSEAMKTGRCEAVVTRLRKNGERFPARAAFAVRRDREGDPAGFVVVERDLSEERVSARLSESAVKQAAQMEDHLRDVRAAHALLDETATQLRAENETLRERIAAAESRSAESDARAAKFERSLATMQTALEDAIVDRTTAETKYQRVIDLAAKVKERATADLEREVAELRARAERAESRLFEIEAVQALPEDIDAGVVPYIEDVDLADVITRARMAVEPFVGARQLAILVDVSENAKRVWTDRGLLRQVLVGLLSNAVKFTPYGKITICARRASNGVEVAVTDTGIGIAESDLEHVFDDSGRLARAGGEITLAVARRIARLLGGDVSVTSRLGWGSTFTVKLPSVISSQ
jgi:PAS domain S-box-containing protein